MSKPSIIKRVGRESIDAKGFFYCEFCHCYTNAKYRGCCDHGRAADRTKSTTTINVAVNVEPPAPVSSNGGGK